MSLGGKYEFATVMSLVLPMCILISCSTVLCVLIALDMFMLMIPSYILAFCVSFVSCIVMMSGWVLCTSFFLVLRFCF